jgi:nucleotide-binding universal stress UspA family protein
VVVVPESAPASAAVARVLVGVDHSSSSLEALRFAARLAHTHHAVLVPVCVHESLRDEAHRNVVALEASERQALLTAAAAAGAGSLQVEPEVVTGHAAQALRAATADGDIMVLGSRGRGGFTGLLLGSTSTQVAQHATCPVVVVRSS